MRVKSMFMLIVINIFSIMLISVILEYINLDERFKLLERTVQTSLNSALEVCTSSEEMFTDQFQATVASYAGSADASIKHSVYATTPLWRNGQWYQVNSFLLAYYYDTRGKLPTDADIASVDTLGGTDTLSFIYKWLYGDIGSAYAAPELNWANRNNEKLKQYKLLSDTRTPSTNFKEYYDRVGSKVTSVGILKEHVSGEKKFWATVKKFPTLTNMGLQLNNFNKKTSSFTHDNFTSSVHYGKSNAKDTNMKDTVYYLTPASLGVTYVPIEVIKPLFLANIETTARLNKMSGGDIRSMGASVRANTMDSADSCVNTSVYDVGSNVPETHTVNSGENIVTDGLVEYDLNSAKVKIDYFFLDFNVNSNDLATIISKVEGVAPGDGGQTAMRMETLRAFKLPTMDSGSAVSDTEFVDNYNTIRNQRIVARVTARIKIHIPYTSSVLQQLCKREGVDHYGIKLWNPTSGTIVSDSDSLWYQYTVYYCQSR